MATENQGIMSLPQGGEKASPQMPQMGLDESYDAVKGGLKDVSPEASAAMQQTLDQITPQLDQLSDQQLDAMIQIFQYLHDHPEEYDEKVKELVNKGVVNQGTLPDQYDPEVLATLIMVFLEAKKQRQAGNQREAAMGMPQPPATMARGGIAEAARMVASQGRSGDTMLAHINKREAKMLKKHGGVGTINPATGLPEYGFFSDMVSVVTAPVRAVGDVLGGVGKAIGSVVNGVVNTIKSVVQSPIGRILGTIALATVLGPTALGATLGTAGTAALSAGTITALGGGNLKDVLRSAATSYLGAPGGPVENFIGNAGAAMGVTNAAGQAAINAGITGTGVGLLTGQSLKDSVKSGLIAGAIQGGITGASKGFGAQTPGMANAPTGESVSGRWNSETGKFEPPVTPTDVQKQIQTGGAPAPTGQGEGAAPTVAQPGQGGGTPPPTGPTGLSRIGGGLSDIVQGNFGAGYENVKGGLSDLYNKISPSEIQKAGATDALKTVQQQFPGVTQDQILNAPAGSVLANAYKAASPGIFSTYGPMLGIGLAATGAMGGFKPNNPAQSEMMNTMKGTPGEDLIKANPSKYITQGLPGVEYDASGNIIGSKPWTPSATLDDIRVPANSMGGGGQYNFAAVQPPMGAMYTPGMGTLGQSRQVYQPYNTADMYSNLMFPRRAAEGGIMEIEEPVRHMMFGGMLSRIADSIRNATQGIAQTVAPAVTAAKSIVAGPTPAPVVSPSQGTGLLGAGNLAASNAAAADPMSAVRAAPVHYAQMPTGPVSQGGSYLSPMQAAQLATPGPGQGNMNGMAGMGGRMTPEMRAAFAQRFAQNMQFDPQAMQQAAMQRQPMQQAYNSMAAYSNFQRPQGRGLASLAEGGYPRRTGQISGPGTEKSDSIPAMLSDGEFVMTAKAVRGAGKGSRRAGAKKMYALMHQLERNASRG